MQVKVIAVGSTKWERFIRRWGVSFLIGEDVLFDTFGDPGVFLNNLQRFHVDVLKIKHIVLSHDDWDHIAGLWYVLHDRKDIRVYICPGFKQEVKERISSFGVDVVEVEGVTLIKDGIHSTGELCGESKEQHIYEQSVVIRTQGNVSVICGCAHPGVANIVRYVKERFQEPIHAVIGGFHLKEKNPQEISDIITQLQLCKIERIAPTHCTGKLATKIFKREFKGGFINVKQGSVIEV